MAGESNADYVATLADWELTTYCEKLLETLALDELPMLSRSRAELQAQLDEVLAEQAKRTGSCDAQPCQRRPGAGGHVRTRRHGRPGGGHVLATGESAQLLPLPRHFAQLSELVTEDMISAPCGPSPEEHLKGTAAPA
jgi:hypothetical protein